MTRKITPKAPVQKLESTSMIDPSGVSGFSKPRHRSAINFAVL